MNEKKIIRATLNNVLLEKIDGRWIVIDIGPEIRLKGWEQQAIERGDEVIVSPDSDTSIRKWMQRNDKEYLLIPEEEVLGVIRTIKE